VAARSTRPGIPEVGTVDDDGPERTPRPARRSHKLAAVLTALTVLVMGFVLVGFYPARTWLRLDRDVRESERDLGVLQRENARLEAELQRLQDPAEIERLARAEYSLVQPGEEAYAILPGATTTTGPGVVTVVNPDGSVHQEPAG
jgi:cell division protein FtsB